jgi:hypothetical protein
MRVIEVTRLLGVQEKLLLCFFFFFFLVLEPVETVVGEIS